MFAYTFVEDDLLAFLPRIKHEQSSTIGGFGAFEQPRIVAEEQRERERERATFEASSRSRERGTEGTNQPERIEQTERKEKREKLPVSFGEEEGVVTFFGRLVGGFLWKLKGFF